nr:TetR/AcrR family transcriptional regulator [Clostridia bacterium]
MQKSLETKARIVRAAIDVFGTIGFDAASMAEIAVKADVAKGTLYLYFASKDQLFEEAYQQCRTERLHACGVDTEAQMGVMDKLCRRLRNGTRWELAAPTKNRLVRAYLTHPVFGKRVAHVVEALNTQALMPIFQQGITEGELRALPLDLLAEMYIRFGSAVYYYIEKHPEDAENETLWQAIYASLRGCMAAAE